MRERIDAVTVINNRIAELPINQAELARRVDMQPELLRRTLNGDRKMNGDELVNLCAILGITLDDFYEVAV